MLSDDAKKIIIRDILPKINDGTLMLFLGAGFSVGTPTKNHYVPSSDELKRIICDKLSNTINIPENSIDLKDAFKLLQAKCDAYEALKDYFIVSKVFEWQIDLLKYWWRAIFTTNIDTTLRECVEYLSSRNNNGNFPNHEIFNYKDMRPVIQKPLQINIIHLHGNILRKEDAFIFDRSAYANSSATQADWLREAAANIMAGGCLILGSRLKEPDIEHALSARRNMFGIRENDRECSLTVDNNWIVLDSFEEYEKDLYTSSKLIPIECKIDEFTKFLVENVRTMTQVAFIKHRLPHLSITRDTVAHVAWFSDAFTYLPELLERASKETCLRGMFYNGATVDWPFIVKDVPADLSYAEDIYKQILGAMNSSSNVEVINVTGPTCCGKTTAIMQALRRIAKLNEAIYIFSADNGIDVEGYWRAIKNIRGTIIFFFDNGYEYFFAIDDIAKRTIDLGGNKKLIFITESRISKFEYHQRHFRSIPADNFHIYEFNHLDNNNANLIVKKINELGVVFENFQNIDDARKVNLLISKQSGYGGDLFAAIYDLSNAKSYEQRIKDEYFEITSHDAKMVYHLLLISSSIRINFPISYLSEACRFSTGDIYNMLNTELRGKITPSLGLKSFSARHASISNYMLKKLVDKRDIFTAVISILEVVGSKFDINDIKFHPLPFRIYKEIISFRFLIENVFGLTRQDLIHSIYEKAELFFNKDSFFWLQYGRFFDRIKNYEKALYCLRTADRIYHADHVTHALGHVLLNKYIHENYSNDDELYEGLTILINAVRMYGKEDPYFCTTLLEMMTNIIAHVNISEAFLRDIKECVNSSMHHLSNSKFSRAIHRYRSAIQKI